MDGLGAETFCNNQCSKGMDKQKVSNKRKWQEPTQTPDQERDKVPCLVPDKIESMANGDEPEQHRKHGVAGQRRLIIVQLIADWLFRHLDRQCLSLSRSMERGVEWCSDGMVQGDTQSVDADSIPNRNRGTLRVKKT